VPVLLKGQNKGKAKTDNLLTMHRQGLAEMDPDDGHMGISVMDMEETEMKRMTITPSMDANGYLPPSLANRCG